MNGRHAIALVLFALAPLFILLGIPALVQNDRLFVVIGLAFVFVGIATFAGGLALYRSCDHRMKPGDTIPGGLRTAFPLRTPLMGIMLVLLTALFAVMLLGDGVDWTHPRFIAGVATYLILVVSFIAVGIRRLRGPRKKTP